MPKPDNYNGIRKIEVAGITLPNGNFIGFLNNGQTAQEVLINGALMYGGLTRATDGITLSVASNAYIPVECNRIKPASFSVIGYF